MEVEIQLGRSLTRRRELRRPSTTYVYVEGKISPISSTVVRPEEPTIYTPLGRPPYRGLLEYLPAIFAASLLYLALAICQFPARAAAPLLMVMAPAPPFPALEAYPRPRRCSTTLRKRLALVIKKFRPPGFAFYKSLLFWLGVAML